MCRFGFVGQALRLPKEHVSTRQAGRLPYKGVASGRWLERALLAAAIGGLALPVTMMGQERAKVSISFLPPPLETATYSLGIYEAKTHKLVRHLQEFAPGSAFTTGLNGLITSWDGKDDDGKAVPPGRYAARGYAVGGLKVEGKAILGNDWAGDSEKLRITHVEAIALVPEDNGLGIVGRTSTGYLQTARYGGQKSELLWQQTFPVPIASVNDVSPMSPERAWRMQVQGNALIVGFGKTRWANELQNGEEVKTPAVLDDSEIPTAGVSSGKDGTTWKIEEGVLGQYSAQGERLRSLAPKDGEPVPVAIAASKTTDKLYLLEESRDVQRVRGLSWKESSKEGDKAVSTWTTFFENFIRPNFVPVGPEKVPLTAQTEITLVENPLSPASRNA